MRTITFKRIKQTIAFTLTPLALMGVFGFVQPQMVAADDCVQIAIPLTGSEKCVPNNPNEDLTSNPIYYWLKNILKFLSAGVGITVVAGVVWGGVMYLSARDSAAQTQKAVGIIINSLIGLVLYIFMFAILNYLIPGGIFS